MKARHLHGGVQASGWSIENGETNQSQLGMSALKNR